MESIGFVITCWLLADLVAGVFHWWEDQYVDDKWPILGRLVGAPNQQHHADPLAFTKPGYWGRNSTTIIPSAILFALLFPSRWCLLAVFLSQANEIHAWSHQRCNWFIQMLQETGILQHPKNHAAHHRDPFDRRYCVMSSILNPILDRLYFWRVLECLAQLCFGVKPRSQGAPQ